MDQTKMICVGDHIESINGRDVSDLRHYEVAKMLKDLEKGRVFKLKLIEPMKSFGECCLAVCLVPWILNSQHCTPL